jgi:hypothetical protein
MRQNRMDANMDVVTGWLADGACTFDGSSATDAVTMALGE